jgi:hypothetical protein
MHIADTRTIALIASKKNFNPDKERLLIQKAKTTKCHCRHPHHATVGEICFFGQCRHSLQLHPTTTTTVGGEGGAGNANNNGIIIRYSIGQKRCQICELFIEFDGVLCPCCNSRLRTRPRWYCFSARLLSDGTITRH